MRKIATYMLGILIVASSAIGLPASAQAQRAPMYTWTGFYIGGFVGAAHHKADWTELNDDWWNGKQTARSTGVYGGLYAGVNFQMSQFLYGLEADFGLASNSTKDNLSDGVYDDIERNRMRWLSTIRARAGYLCDNYLFFVTGGLAIADFNTKMSSNDFPGEVYHPSGVRVGWVAGGGVEYRFGGNMAVRAEGLFHSFGSKTYEQPIQPDDRDRIKNTVITGRIGFSWYFN